MNNLNFYQKTFVKELVKRYGYGVRDTYKGIANNINGMSYVSVRNYLLRLEEAKLLQIENKGKRHQIYYLDKNKLDLILNEPCI